MTSSRSDESRHNNPRPNPYVGPRTFQSHERLYGRETETRKLTNLLSAERVVVFYSPSGAGKSSLINAALLPEMVKRGYHVRPVARVAGACAAKLACNRYVFAVLASLEQAYPRDQQLDAAALAHLTLVEYFKQRPRPADLSLELLIIDQFEEVLTIDPTDGEAKTEFFEQLGAALTDTSRWALFAMREEYLGALAPYGLAVPNGFRRTFRLDLMGTQGALRALQETAANAIPSVVFEHDAAMALISDLQLVNVQALDGSVRSTIGPHVELVQLQVVAMRLWETLAPNSTQITIDDVRSEDLGDVSRALAKFYDDRVATAARDSGINEREVREWFDEHLITKSGIRGQVLAGIGLPEGEEWRPRVASLYELLQSGRILRAQERGGAIWYELAHDRMIEPVRTSNRDWFDKNLGAFQKQAALWQQRDRADELLLSEDALKAAEKWIAESKAVLTKEEQQYLAQSQKKIDEQARRLRQLRGLVAGLVVLFLLTAAALWIARTERKFAVEQSKEAEAQTKIAETQRKIAETQSAEAKRQEQLAHAAKARAEEQERKAVAGESAARTAQEMAWQSLATLAFLKNEADELEKAFSSPYAIRSPDLKFKATAQPTGGFIGTKRAYHFKIYPDEQIRTTTLAHATSVQYLPGVGFDHKLRIATKPKFEFTYTGWGCMTQVWVLVSFDDDAPKKTTELNMCRLLGWPEE